MLNYFFGVFIGYLAGYVFAKAVDAWFFSKAIERGRFQFYDYKYKIEKVEDDNEIS